MRIPPISRTPVIAANRANSTPEQSPEKQPLPLQSAPRTDGRYLVEPVSGELVYQTVDLESGEVVRQLPDANYLRNRAYARLLAKAEMLAAL